MARQQASARAKIIDAVRAPLGFFVLALLIVEAFLATVLVGGSLERADKITGMFLGAGLFLFLAIVVCILVWFKPENLTFDKEAHLKSREQGTFGTQSRPIQDRDHLLPSENTTTGAKP